MKKLLSIFLTTLMIFSVFSVGALTVSADTTALAVENISTFSSFLELTFNKEIAEASLNNIKVYEGTSDTAIEAVNTLSADSKTVKVTYSTPINITKAYTIKADVISDKTGENLITDYSQGFSFDVAMVENFDSYSSIDDLITAGYVYKGHGASNFSSLAQLKENQSETAPIIALVDDGNNGKKLALRKNGDASLFKNGVTVKHWYTFEITLDAGEEKRPTFDINRDPYGYYYADNLYSLKFRTWETLVDCFTNKVSGANGDPLMAPYGKFDMIYDAALPSADAASGILSIYYNGNLAGKKDNIGKYKSNSQPASNTDWGSGDDCKDCFGLQSQSNDVQYVDNIKVYRKKISTPSYTNVTLPTFTSAHFNSAPDIGQKLECIVDDTTQTEGISYTYKWYTAADSTATFPSEWTEHSNTASTLTITEAESDKYICCVVTQNVENSDGSLLPVKQVRTSPFYGAIVPPEARNVKLSEEKDENGTLTAIKVKYDYFDPNIIDPENDLNLEDGTTFVWEKSDKKGEDAVWTATDVTTDTYPVTKDDVEYFVRCTVKVANKAEKGDEATPVTTEIYTLPFAPVATVSLTQSATAVGSNVIASYEYYDENGDKEKDSDYGWYRCTSLTDEGTKVGNGFAYGIQTADMGYYLVFKVTPKTDVYPETGKTAETERIYIPAPVQDGTSGGYVSSGVTSSGTASSGGSSFSSSYKNEVSKDNFTSNETFTSVTFDDVKNHWAKSEIEKLAKKGIVKGDENGYNPEGSLTRAEWATMLARLAELNLNNAYSGKFADVNAGDWYATAVEAILSSGIMNGDGDTFRPNDKISREEMAKSLCALYDYLKKSSTEKEFDVSGFGDNASISDWALAYVEKACGLGLMQGDEKGNFNAKGYATRAEAAVVLVRVTEAN